MLLYRIFNHHPLATDGQPGHPSFLPRPQAKGRWDNAVLYDSWYLARSAEGAVGETFGNLETWSESMFERAYLPGGRMSLASFEAPDDLAIFDLDDANNLLTVGMKPSQVVTRNIGYTQSRAAAIFGEGKWAGIGWWSFHRPFWSNVMLWSTPSTPAPLKVAHIEPLTFTHPAVASAQKTLAKPSKR